MDYIGKICPYCQTPFKEGDDVVVCSVCEMPHHKECWIENKACTTFGCTGTISGIDQQEQDRLMPTFCTNCGTQLSSSQKFCTSCGTPVRAASAPHYQVAAQPAYQQYQHTGPKATDDENFRSFVFTEVDTYKNFFEKLYATGSYFSWNWSSFLAGYYWFAYRKLYIHAAIAFGATLLLSMIPYVGSVFSLAISVACGLFGNYFYKQYVEKELAAMQGMNEAERAAYATKRGGTSWAAVGIAIGLACVFSCCGGIGSFLLQLILSNL